MKALGVFIGFFFLGIVILGIFFGSAVLAGLWFKLFLVVAA